MRGNLKNTVRRVAAWIVISLIAGGLMLRDLWKHGELRGGHIWREWNEEGERWCVMCGATNGKLSCRESALRFASV